MFKVIFLIITIIFSLSSCWKTENDNLKFYDWGWFSIKIPKKWEVLWDKSSILPKPSTWKIELAVSSKLSSKDMYNSLVILSEDLEKNISSKNYSKSNNLSSRLDYFFYSEVSNSQISFWEEHNSNLYIFDAKYNIDTPEVKFLQVWAVCKNKGYILTLALPKTTKDTLKYEYMLSSFRCK